MSWHLPRIRVWPPFQTQGSLFAPSTDNGDASWWGVAGIHITATTDAITRVCIPYSTKAGTTPTYKVSIQGVDGSGDPDGTIKGGGSPASVTFNPSSLGWSDNTMQVLTLDNSYTPSRGEIIAIVIEYESGTVDTSNYARFVDSWYLGPFDAIAKEKSGASSWTSSNYASTFGYGTATHIMGTPVLSASSSVSINSTGVAIKFTVPTTMAASTLTIAGATFRGSSLTSGDIQITLYDGGGSTDRTILQQSSRDGDALYGGPAIAMFDEASLSELTAGNTYRLEFSAPSGSFNVQEIDAGDSGCRKPWAGPWNAFKSTWGGSSWTDDETKVLSVQDLIIGSMTASGGGGGGGRRPRLQTLC